MTRRLGLAAVVLLMCLPALAAPRAASVRIHRPAGELTGPVIAMIDGQECRIADNAWNAWLIRGGQSVVYSGTDGAGGFEDEGQSLWRYDVATGRYGKLMTEFFSVEKVVEARSASGKLALLVTMADGGLGAPHVAVVDPDRGQVWRQRVARIVGIRNGRIAVAVFDPDTIGQPKPVIRRMLYHDLDRLLSRQASPDWPVGVPR